LGYDRVPIVLLGNASALRQRTLPAVGGDVLVRSLHVASPELRVRGFDVTAFTRGEEGSVEWLSADGGASWPVTRRSPGTSAREVRDVLAQPPAFAEQRRE